MTAKNIIQHVPEWSANGGRRFKGTSNVCVMTYMQIKDAFGIPYSLSSPQGRTQTLGEAASQLRTMKK